MGAQKFQNLTDGELADIWYALGGAEARHTGGFTQLLDAAFAELNGRLGDSLAPFLEERYRPYRLADSKEDAAANARPAAGDVPVRDTWPA